MSDIKELSLKDVSDVNGMSFDEASQYETRWDKARDKAIAFGKGMVDTASLGLSAIDIGAQGLSSAIEGKDLEEDQLLTTSAAGKSLRRASDWLASHYSLGRQADQEAREAAVDRVRENGGSETDQAIAYLSNSTFDSVVDDALESLTGSLSAVGAGKLIAKYGLKQSMPVLVRALRSRGMDIPTARSTAKKVIETGGLFYGTHAVTAAGLGQEIMEENVKKGNAAGHNLFVGSVAGATPTALSEAALMNIAGSGSTARLFGMGRSGSRRAIAASVGDDLPKSGFMRDTVRGFKGGVKGGAVETATEFGQGGVEQAMVNIAVGNPIEQGTGVAAAQGIAASPLGAISGAREAHSDNMTYRQIRAARNREADLLARGEAEKRAAEAEAAQQAEARERQREAEAQARQRAAEAEAARRQAAAEAFRSDPEHNNPVRSGVGEAVSGAYGPQQGPAQGPAFASPGEGGPQVSPRPGDDYTAATRAAAPTMGAARVTGAEGVNAAMEQYRREREAEIDGVINSGLGDSGERFSDADRAKFSERYMNLDPVQRQYMKARMAGASYGGGQGRRVLGDAVTQAEKYSGWSQQQIISDLDRQINALAPKVKTERDGVALDNLYATRAAMMGVSSENLGLVMEKFRQARGTLSRDLDAANQDMNAARAERQRINRQTSTLKPRLAAAQAAAERAAKARDAAGAAVQKARGNDEALKKAQGELKKREAAATRATEEVKRIEEKIAELGDQGAAVDTQLKGHTERASRARHALGEVYAGRDIDTVMQGYAPQPTGGENEGGNGTEEAGQGSGGQPGEQAPVGTAEGQGNPQPLQPTGEGERQGGDNKPGQPDDGGSGRQAGKPSESVDTDDGKTSGDDKGTGQKGPENPVTPSQTANRKKGDFSSQMGIEAAPNPNDTAAVAKWNKLNSKQKLAVTKKVTKFVLGKVAQALGVESHTVSLQTGGWDGTVNYSVNVSLSDPNKLYDAAMISGRLLRQQGVFAMSGKPAKGLVASTVLRIRIPKELSRQVGSIYTDYLDKARDEDTGAPLIRGMSYANGEMLIGLDSADNAEYIAEKLSEKLQAHPHGGDLEVEVNDAYTAFIMMGESNASENSAEGYVSPAVQRQRELEDSLRESVDAYFSQAMEEAAGGGESKGSAGASGGQSREEVSKKKPKSTAGPAKPKSTRKTPSPEEIAKKKAEIEAEDQRKIAERKAEQERRRKERDEARAKAKAEKEAKDKAEKEAKAKAKAEAAAKKKAAQEAERQRKLAERKAEQERRRKEREAKAEADKKAKAKAEAEAKAKAEADKKQQVEKLSNEFSALLRKTWETSGQGITDAEWDRLDELADSLKKAGVDTGALSRQTSDRMHAEAKEKYAKMPTAELLKELRKPADTGHNVSLRKHVINELEKRLEGSGLDIQSLGMDVRRGWRKCGADGRFDLACVALWEKGPEGKILVKALQKAFDEELRLDMPNTMWQLVDRILSQYDRLSSDSDLREAVELLKDPKPENASALTTVIERVLQHSARASDGVVNPRYAKQLGLEMGELGAVLYEQSEELEPLWNNSDGMMEGAAYLNAVVEGYENVRKQLAAAKGVKGMGPRGLPSMLVRFRNRIDKWLEMGEEESEEDLSYQYSDDRDAAQEWQDMNLPLARDGSISDDVGDSPWVVKPKNFSDLEEEEQQDTGTAAPSGGAWGNLLGQLTKPGLYSSIAKGKGRPDAERLVSRLSKVPFLGKAFDTLRKRGKVKVVSTFADLPKDLRDRLEQVQKSTAYKNGKDKKGNDKLVVLANTIPRPYSQGEAFTFYGITYKDAAGKEHTIPAGNVYLAEGLIKKTYKRGKPTDTGVGYLHILAHNMQDPVTRGYDTDTFATDKGTITEYGEIIAREVQGQFGGETEVYLSEGDIVLKGKDIYAVLGKTADGYEITTLMPLSFQLKNSQLLGTAMVSHPVASSQADYQATGRGMTPSQVQVGDKKQRADLSGGRDQKAVNTWLQRLGLSPYKTRFSKDGALQGLYDPKTGTSYLIAEGIEEGNEAAVLGHEVGIHMAADPAAKQAMQPVLKRAADLIANADRLNDPVAKRARQRLLAAGESLDNAHECAAYLAEEAMKEDAGKGPVARWWSNLVRVIKGYLIRTGVRGVDSMSGKDFGAIAVANIRAMAGNPNGSPTGPGGGDQTIRFSKAGNGPTPSGNGPSPSPSPSSRANDDSLMHELERMINDRAVTLIGEHVPAKLQPLALKVLDAVNKVYGGVMGLAFTRDLVKMAAPVMKSAQTWFDTQLKRESVKGKFSEMASNIHARVYGRGMNGQSRQRINEFLERATVDGVFWTTTKPAWMRDEHWQAYLRGISEHGHIKPDKLQKQRALAAQFAKLSAEERSIALDVFKDTYNLKIGELEQFEAHIQDTLSKLKDSLVGSRDELMKKQTLTKREQARLQDLNDRIAECDQQISEYSNLAKDKASMLFGPYVPLSRFGDHFVIGKSQAYLDTEAKLDALLDRKRKDPASIDDADRKLIKDLRKQLSDMESDGSHYYMEAVNGAATAAARRRALNNSGMGLVFREPVPVQEALGRGGVEWRQLASLVESAEQAQNERAFAGGSDQAALEEIKRLGNVLLVRSLYNGALQGKNLQRRTVKGYDRNMLHSYFDYAGKQATHIANLTTFRDSAKALSQMIDEKKTASDDKRMFMGKVFNELAKRNRLLTMDTNNDWAGKVQRFNANWMLFTNAGYYLQNATQPFMMSLPYMAGKFNYTKIGGELASTYASVAKALARHPAWDTQTLMNEGIINAEEAKMLEQLRQEQLLDLGMASEWGTMDDSENKVMQGIKVASDFMQSANQKLEACNRIATALVAYRNAKAQPSKVYGYGRRDQNGKFTAENDSLAYAREVVVRTHGDYSSLNSPRFFLPNGMGMGGVEKLLTQFRKYQMIQIGFLINQWHGWLKGKTPEERAEYRKAFLSTMATYLATTGMTGSPLLGTVLAVAAMAFGDDDEDKDEYLRRLVGDKTTADLLLRGLPGAAGLDLGTFIGIGDAFKPFPFAKFNKDDSSAKNWLWNVSGPTGSNVERIWNGAEDIMGSWGGIFDGSFEPYIKFGQFIKGLEQALPKGPANLLKAVDYQVRGVVSRKGNTQLSADEISGLASLGVAVGLPTSTITDMYKRQSSYFERKDWLEARDNEIKRLIKEGETRRAVRLIPERNRAAMRNGVKTKSLTDFRKSIADGDKRRAKQNAQMRRNSVY